MKWHVDLTAVPAFTIAIAWVIGAVIFETTVVVLLALAAVYSGPP